jgi:phosphopantothenoylcysteine decarboxylase/phosphopantothenate--cysteine ligase
LARILLGISGGIAAYKVIDLASALTQRGDEVISLLTPNALKFVTPLSLRAITQQRVHTDPFEDLPEASTEHISLATWGDVFLIAPATADLIARAACGLASDIVTTTLLAFQGPVLLAPSMNDKMWAHPIVQSNLARLKELGYSLLEPESGHLACGSTGPGRLPSTLQLLAALDKLLQSKTGK